MISVDLVFSSIEKSDEQSGGIYYCHVFNQHLDISVSTGGAKIIVKGMLYYKLQYAMAMQINIMC